MLWGTVGRPRKTYSTNLPDSQKVSKRHWSKQRCQYLKEVCLSKRGVSDTTDSFIVTSMASVDALLDTEADDATGRILFYLMYLTCNEFHNSGLILVFFGVVFFCLGGCFWLVFLFGWFLFGVFVDISF